MKYNVLRVLFNHRDGLRFGLIVLCLRGYGVGKFKQAEVSAALQECLAENLAVFRDRRFFLTIDGQIFLLTSG